MRLSNHQDNMPWGCPWPYPVDDTELALPPCDTPRLCSGEDRLYWMRGTLPGEIRTNLCSFPMGNWQQTKVRIPPNSNLANQCILLRLLTDVWGRGYFQEQKWLRASCITKVHPGMGDGSLKPGTCSTLHTQQVAHQVGGSFLGN